MAVATETLPNPAKALDKDPAGQHHRRERSWAQQDSKQGQPVPDKQILGTQNSEGGNYVICLVPGTFLHHKAFSRREQH